MSLRKLKPALGVVLGLTLAIPALVQGEGPQDGSVTSADAELLWNRANEAFNRSDFGAAAHDLRRLVERIPTHQHSLAAQKLLGESELRLQNFDAAQKAFETFLANMCHDMAKSKYISIQPF
jgi:TolA-binding protein